MKCTAMVRQVLIMLGVSSWHSLIVSVLTEEGSDRFHQFLDLLGDEVQLRGWQNFRGGLDNKSRYYCRVSAALAAVSVEFLGS